MYKLTVRNKAGYAAHVTIGYRVVYGDDDKGGYQPGAVLDRASLPVQQEVSAEVPSTHVQHVPEEFRPFEPAHDETHKTEGTIFVEVISSVSDDHTFDFVVTEDTTIELRGTTCKPYYKMYKS